MIKSHFFVFLQHLSSKPTLRNSELLYNFLTQPDDFTLPNGEIILSKMFKVVPRALRIEVGRKFSNNQSIIFHLERTITWTISYLIIKLYRTIEIQSYATKSSIQWYYWRKGIFHLSIESFILVFSLEIQFMEIMQISLNPWQQTKQKRIIHPKKSIVFMIMWFFLVNNVN